LDEARIDEAKRRTVTPIVWAAGIGVLIILAAGGLEARSFLRRLRTLSEAVTGIASGRDPGRVPVEGRDELGRYADAFNRMVDALAESRDRVVHAERMAALGKLASAVAHEIRNPLASIRMTAEVLRPDLAGDDAHEALGLLLNELKRLELFLDEILTLSGKTVIEKDDADVGELVQETLALLQGNLTHLGIQAESILAPGLVHVLDADRVKQVLVNLLLNGAKAAGPGGQVRVSGEKTGDGSLRIEVRDSGPGVDAGIEGRLFEPFFTTRKGGTGLGLAVCRRIAEAHGGRIAYRREGEWTVFGLELPP
jgi:two-component system sensor histidine kinase AtoS